MRQIPKHHQQWFNVLKQAALGGGLALMSCTDKATGKDRTVICVVNNENGEFAFTPLAEMAETESPFDQWDPPPEMSDIGHDEPIQPDTTDHG